jgi:hypothetical protein
MMIRLVCAVVVLGVIATATATYSASGQDATPEAATPGASPAATPEEITLDATGDRYELSGNGVVGLSDAFRLTDGNWFYTIDATGTGSLTRMELVQVGGDGSEFLIGVGYQELPYEAEGVIRIFDAVGEDGDYVLYIKATDPASLRWRVVISTTPP